MGESTHGFFSSCCHVGVCAIFEKVVQVSERFLLTLGGLWWATSLLFKKNPLVLQVFFIPIVH
jgi:metal-dependent hydrolase (beta-lactamase superfamily II)